MGIIQKATILMEKMYSKGYMESSCPMSPTSFWRRKDVGDMGQER